MDDKMVQNKTINIDDAKDLIKTGNVILADIRDGQSYTQAHIPDAIHLTDENLDEIKKNTTLDETIIIYCYHGINSLGAAQYFSNMGYRNVFSLNGGFSEYSKHNF